ncbi:prepilin-type N-terminal cleavage/methylation domain-containing protein [Candidatus Saccharibacteria bacterium]|nr:prepilin-type N-terminal cleavage/methylation domain-containing protein [Candidatus Saccharibacteria bacterium]
MRFAKGFTIVEIAVVVAVIGILASITVVSYNNVQISSRDDSSRAKALVVTEALERHYEKYGEFPTCAQMTTAATTVAATLQDINPDALRRPSATTGTNSISCTAPSKTNFSYIVTTSPVGYTYGYQEEATSQNVTFKNRQ